MRVFAQTAGQVTALARLSAELLGTFMLVFAGTGAIVIDQQTGGALGTTGIALVFGLTVMGVIAAFGDISGAHINPAVTLAFWAARRFPGSLVVPYLLAQCAGAVSASLCLAVWFGAESGLGVTLPRQGVAAAVGFELLMSGFLMLVILGVAHGARERGLLAAVTIGGVVGLEAAFGGPVSGASMNPARSLAPALVGGQLQHLWLYLLVPVVGMLLAVPLCAALRGHACCLGRAEGCRS